MRKFSWKLILAWLLVAFFITGGIANIFVSAETAADYQRWGYPAWFHYVTGLLELSTAVLLAYKPFRLWGAALGATVMVAAGATVIIHGEYTHAIPPAVVFLLALAVAEIVRRERGLKD